MEVNFTYTFCFLLNATTTATRTTPADSITTHTITATTIITVVIETDDIMTVGFKVVFVVMVTGSVISSLVVIVTGSGVPIVTESVNARNVLLNSPIGVSDAIPLSAMQV